MNHRNYLGIPALAIGFICLTVLAGPRAMADHSQPGEHGHPEEETGARDALQTEDIQGLIDAAIRNLLFNPGLGGSPHFPGPGSDDYLQGDGDLSDEPPPPRALARLQTQKSRTPSTSQPPPPPQVQTCNQGAAQPVCQAVRPKKVKIMTGRMNINTASAEYLTMLPGVGASKAQAIINYRQRRPFRHARHIIRVKGMNWKHYARIKDFLTIDGESDFHHRIYPPGYVAPTPEDTGR